MKLQELASLMNISKKELIEQLKRDDVIELKLTERENGMAKNKGKVEILD